jgi:hypothetical protein
MSSLLDFNIRKGSASESPLNVLFVEDNPGDVGLSLRALRNARFEIEFKLATGHHFRRIRRVPALAAPWKLCRLSKR